MKQILDYLAQLGFSEIESIVYMKLLESGPMTVAELGKAVKLNRTAVYPYVYSLLDKGVIAELMIDSRKQFAATDPERLEYLIEKKQNSLRVMQNQLPNILTTINTAFPGAKNEKKAGVQFLKGISNVRAIYNEAFNGNEMRSFVKVEDVPLLASDNLILFNNAFKKNKKLKVWEIVYESPFAKRQAIKILAQHFSNCFFKFMPSDLKWSLTSEDIVIYDGKVAVINYSDGVSAVILQSPDFYNNFKELFNFIWRILPESNDSK